MAETKVSFPNIHDQRSVYDVIIVGAGIQGSATAYECVKQGLNTLLLEQFSLPHSRGSSHGQSRIIRYSYDQPHYAEMMLEAFPLWMELEREMNTELYKNTGLLTISTNQTGNLYHSSLRHMKRYGRAFKILDQAAVKREYPELDLPSSALVFLDYSGGTLRADRALRTYQSAFVKRGGTLLDEQKVLAIEPGTKVMVKTSGGEFCGKSLVLTPGAWAGQLLRLLGLDPPLKVMRINVPYWKEKESGGMKRLPNFRLDLGARHDYDHIYGLQSMEYPGLTKVASHWGCDYVDPDCRDSVLQEEKSEIKFLKRIIARHLPRLESEPTIMETCMYTNTPDGELIIDTHPVYPNIAVCCGCSGHGFKLAPSVGKLLYRLATGKQPHIDIKALSFSRFKNSCVTSKANL